MIRKPVRHRVSEGTKWRCLVRLSWYWTVDPGISQSLCLQRNPSCVCYLWILTRGWIYRCDFAGIPGMSCCAGGKKALSLPSWVHKISTTVGEKESGRHEVRLHSRAVLPEILGSVGMINGTSAGFSKTKWADNGGGVEVWTGAFWLAEIHCLAANAAAVFNPG